MRLPWWLRQESTGSVGNLGSIPGLRWSPGGGHGNLLQYPSWRISWTEEPGRRQSTGSQRVGHDWAAKHSTASRKIKQYSFVNKADPWTTWVWTAQVHLYVGFFPSQYVLQYCMIHSWVLGCVFHSEERWPYLAQWIVISKYVSKSLKGILQEFIVIMSHLSK